MGRVLLCRWRVLKGVAARTRRGGQRVWRGCCVMYLSWYWRGAAGRGGAGEGRGVVLPCTADRESMDLC